MIGILQTSYLLCYSVGDYFLTCLPSNDIQLIKWNTRTARGTGKSSAPKEIKGHNKG